MASIGVGSGFESGSVFEFSYTLEVEGKTFPLTIDTALAQRGFNDVKQSLTYDPDKGESPGKLRHFVAVD